MGYLGHSFFVTLVDDCTQFTWIYLLKHKSDVSTIILVNINIFTQFDKKMKVFRSDNAQGWPLQTSFMMKWFFISFLMLIVHNKTLLMKGSTNTY